MSNYNVERFRFYRDEKRVLISEYLREHPCVDCGEKDIRTLEFDHQRDKTKGVSRYISGGTTSWERILEEISKCEVRCSNCHQKRTIGTPAWFEKPEEFKSDVDQRRAFLQARRDGKRAQHGSRRRYQNGCRCNPCTTANTTYQQKFRGR